MASGSTQHFATLVLVASLIGCAHPPPPPPTDAEIERRQRYQTRIDRILRFAREGRAKGCPKQPRILSAEERQALTPISIPEGYLRRCERYPVRPLSGPTVSGEYEVCVHPEGFVYDVRVQRSSGVTDLDERLIEGARLWVYDPELRDGRAVAFCHPMVVRWREGDPPSEP